MNFSASPLQRFNELHAALHARFRRNNIALQAVNTGMSALTYVPEQALVFAYIRLFGDAQIVQQLIGLTGPKIDIQRHPLIEFRLTEQHLTLEFVLSPLAWWDQRNLIGKLSVRRHRDELRDLLLAMPPEMLVGHWHGTHLDSQHITLGRLRAARALDAWLQTLTDGQDAIRLGLWLETSSLDSATLPRLYETLKSLYGVYRFLAWTGGNDFQTFYNQLQKSR